MQDDLLHRKRLSRIYYNKKFFFYPIRFFNALAGLGPWNSLMIVCSYIYAHLFPNRDELTFEAWITNRFGRRLFATFFKSYTEKVWGVPCREISSEWASQRIRGLSLSSALRNAVVRCGGSKKGVERTLIESFDYPRKGPGMMWEAVAKRITEQGSELWLNSEAERIIWDVPGKKILSVEVMKDGRKTMMPGDQFMSSMPLRELVQKMDPEPPLAVRYAALKLRYRDFLTVALIINRSDLFPDNWLYIHDPEVRVGRIQNFKNWSPFMVSDNGKSCLGLEYFCSEGDQLWSMQDSELIGLAGRELEKVGLACAAEVEDGSVVRMPKAYPAYDANYRQGRDVIREFLGQITNLQLIGRNGLHRYNNQDHSMYTAMLAVENLRGAKHDLWNVNEEKEYQEQYSAG